MLILIQEKIIKFEMTTLLHCLGDYMVLMVNIV
jgi:hypothetical protein